MVFLLKQTELFKVTRGVSHPPLEGSTLTAMCSSYSCSTSSAPPTPLGRPRRSSTSCSSQLMLERRIRRRRKGSHRVRRNLRARRLPSPQRGSPPFSASSCATGYYRGSRRNSSRRHRKTEKDEDKELIEQEEEADATFRFSESPSCKPASHPSLGHEMGV